MSGETRVMIVFLKRVCRFALSLLEKMERGEAI